MVIFENVYDLYNISVVLCLCEVVGIVEVFIFYIEEYLQEEYLELGKKSLVGVCKWLIVNYYIGLENCFCVVCLCYDFIYVIYMVNDVVLLYELDLMIFVVLLFGNEYDGVSVEVLVYVDGNFFILQVGMV